MGGHQDVFQADRFCTLHLNAANRQLHHTVHLVCLSSYVLLHRILIMLNPHIAQYRSSRWCFWLSYQGKTKLHHEDQKSFGQDKVCVQRLQITVAGEVVALQRSRWNVWSCAHCSRHRLALPSASRLMLLSKATVAMGVVPFETSSVMVALKAGSATSVAKSAMVRVEPNFCSSASNTRYTFKNQNLRSTRYINSHDPSKRRRSNVKRLTRGWLN